MGDLTAESAFRWWQDSERADAANLPSFMCHQCRTCIRLPRGFSFDWINDHVRGCTGTFPRRQP